MINRGEHAYENYTNTYQTIKFYALIVVLMLVIAVVPITLGYYSFKIMTFLIPI